MKEQWRVHNKSYKAFAQALRIDPVVAKILANRCGSPEEARAFLDKGGELKDPFLMLDMEKAVALILSHVDAGHPIQVIGDYDVDGMTSSAILGRALHGMGARVLIRIPDRAEDGYGIRPYMVEESAEKGIRLIITCDNGIREFEAVRRAAELGVDVVITDHHEIGKEDGRDVLPEAAAVINPHRQNDPYGFPGLCGAGVAYQLARALYIRKGLPEDPDWIGYASLGTVCDVMDLLGENRKLVSRGLERFNRQPPAAIKALMKQGGIDSLSVYAYGFVLGPMINSGGRLDVQERYIAVLLENDPLRSEQMAIRLSQLNNERKMLTEAGVEHAKEICEQQKEDAVQVIYLPDLHESLAGLVAGKVREYCQHPVFVLTGHGEHVKGSGRSIPAYSMIGEMEKVSDVFLRYGGHPMAAGLSMEESRIEEFRRRLNENQTLREEDFQPVVMLDMAMPLSYACGEDADALTDRITDLGPFGKGNPEPLFGDRGLALSRVFWMGGRKKAARLVLEKEGRVFEATTFRIEALEECVREAGGEALWQRVYLDGTVNASVRLDIAYHLQWNVYRGQKRRQIVVSHLRVSGG